MFRGTPPPCTEADRPRYRLGGVEQFHRQSRAWGYRQTRKVRYVEGRATDPAAASAQALAQAYHQRWEHETGNDQLKTHLRGPGQVLRSTSPDMVRQEIYGYLLTRYAISTLICRAATEADIDPDRITFTRTLRIVRRASLRRFSP